MSAFEGLELTRQPGARTRAGTLPVPLSGFGSRLRHAVDPLRDTYGFSEPPHGGPAPLPLRFIRKRGSGEMDILGGVQ
jgi:hypothetical protein